MSWLSLFTAISPTRLVVRRSLRAWARHGKAHGYYYQTAEAFGHHVASTGTIPVKLPNGLTMHCDLRDHVQRQIYYQGVYEMIEAFLFTRLLEPGMVVVDAGANVGQYSLLAAAAVSPTGIVHAFEPVPKNYERIQRHLIENRVTNVRLNRAGLWHEPTTISLGLASDMLENDGSFSVGVTSDSSVPLVTAPALRFDDYASEQGLQRIDLVKMDIEGSELSALKGMAGSLEKFLPTLLMEVNRRACESMGYTTADLWGLLVGRLGYTAWRIGISAAAWQTITDPTQIVQANCLFTRGALPSRLPNDWNFRSVIRWAASQGRPYSA